MNSYPAFFAEMLLLLEAGNYPARVARIMGLTKQKVHYWARKAEKDGLLRSRKVGRFNFFRLTKAGQDYGNKNLTGGEKKPTFRLHAFSLKYAIVEAPRIPVEWAKVAMQNWDRFIGSEMGLKVEKTTKSVIVHADQIMGVDPFESLLYAYRQCDSLARYLESKFQMRLGPGQPLRKPHFAVRDPLAEFLGKFMEFSDDLAKMDESEGAGELDIFDPRYAKNYLITFTALPALVSKQQKSLDDIHGSMSKFSDTVELFGQEIKQHLELTMEYREESQASRKAIEAFTETVQELKGLVEEMRKPKRKRAPAKRKPRKKEGLLTRLRRWW